MSGGLKTARWGVMASSFGQALLAAACTGGATPTETPTATAVLSHRDTHAGSGAHLHTDSHTDCYSDPQPYGSPRADFDSAADAYLHTDPAANRRSHSDPDAYAHRYHYRDTTTDCHPDTNPHADSHSNAVPHVAPDTNTNGDFPAAFCSHHHGLLGGGYHPNSLHVRWPGCLSSPLLEHSSARNADLRPNHGRP